MADVAQGRTGLLARMNRDGHRASLTLFLVIVLAHWAEHLVQAFQIWVLGMARPDSRGVLGQWFPWVVSSEWLHYAYALVMLVGLLVLLPGFGGSSRTWWIVSLAIQFWHHIEHLLLFIQAQAGVTFFGQAVPTSLIQLIVPRVELHLFYNAVVFVPMVIAMVLHRRGPAAQQSRTSCSCVVRMNAGMAGSAA